jgi:hypothetical protein
MIAKAAIPAEAEMREGTALTFAEAIIENRS